MTACAARKLAVVPAKAATITTDGYGLVRCFSPLVANTFRTTGTEGRGPGLRRDDVVRLARITFSLLQAKRHLCPQIPSREWEVQLSPSTKGEGGGGTPKGAPLNRAAAFSRAPRKQRHTATPLSVPPRRLLRPWDLTSERRRERTRHPGRFPHLSPVSSSHFKAAPRSGHGRLPKAPRVRRARPPRPQAPHPAPRYKRPGNAPLTGTG